MGEKLTTVITIDLESMDKEVREMLEAYEKFKALANAMAPGFQDGHISVCIKKAASQ